MPSRKSVHFSLDNPQVLLLAAVVTVTLQCFSKQMRLLNIFKCDSSTVKDRKQTYRRDDILKVLFARKDDFWVWYPARQIMMHLDGGQPVLQSQSLSIRWVLSFTSYYVDNEAIINVSEVQSMACWAHTLWSYNSNRSLETEYYISPHIKQYLSYLYYTYIHMP